MAVPLVVAIPVLGLLAGTAAGLACAQVPPGWLAAPCAGAVLLMWHAWRVGSAGLLAACVAAAFATGGAAMAIAAWADAWRPPLLRAFELASAAQHLETEPFPDAGTLDESASVVVEGVLRADAAPTASGAVSLALDVDTVEGDGIPGGAQRVHGGIALTVGGVLAQVRHLAWRAGRRVRAPVELHRPARYLDPGVPDFEKASARRGIRLVGSVKSAALVEVVARGHPAAETAAAVRFHARRAIDAAVGPWSPRSAAIVRAIVIGDRTGLDPDLQRRLQEAGTYHVLAISGGNVALLAGGIVWLFRAGGLLGRTAMVCASIALGAYGLTVVGGASVTRATLMALVYFIGLAWDLRGPPLHALLLVAGLMVLADPLAVADVATLLTFGATLGIVHTAGAVSRLGVPTGLRSAAAIVLATAAAEVVLLPVSAYVFERVTVAGLVLNLGAIPLMAVAQLGGMAIVPLAMVSPWAAGLSGGLAHLGAEGLVRSADLVTLAPWLSWRVPAPSPWLIAVYYGAVAAAWTMGRTRAEVDAAEADGRAGEGGAAGATGRARRWRVGEGTGGGESRARRAARRTGASLAMAAAFAMLAGTGPPWPARFGGVGPFAGPGDAVPAGGRDSAGRLRVTFLDVGQGDAALVRFPRGSSLLIDTGGLTGRATFDVGDRVVGPALRRLGVRRLDGLVLTHGDADHVGGAASLVRDFVPWDIWEGIPVPPSPSLRRIRHAGLAVRARWTTTRDGFTTSVEEAALEVHHPTAPDWERQTVRNDDSIVFDLRWRDVSFVFTGDIGREVERELVGRFAAAPLRVVKVPHHGSRSSSTPGFIHHLRPSLAVVSAGRGNRFGHPSRSVMAAYEAAAALVLRTDRDGAITVSTDGYTLDVETVTGAVFRLPGPSPGATTRGSPSTVRAALPEAGTG